MAKLFLQAEWRKLAIANYAVDPMILKKYLPDKTEIDFWNGTCYVSLVGFMFVNTKVLGIKIPFHVNFEEVNLRFYVRYNDKGEWKRGVVFVKEIVPKPALTFVANTIYNEHYETLPMSHTWNYMNDALLVEYKWKKNRWHSFRILADKSVTVIRNGSEEEFITEHYWGYTKVTTGKTSEYGVEHPRWDVYNTKEFQINVDFEMVYGKDFAFLTDAQPKSVFLAEGSEIAVKEGKVI